MEENKKDIDLEEENKYEFIDLLKAIAESNEGKENE